MRKAASSTAVFGPVPSRRFGRSLGVDLTPFKTCSYDCIYCQLGRTTNLTVERRQWVPLAGIADAVRARLDHHLDYITVAGSGEPTLHSGLGELLAELAATTCTPLAVLTNGSLLGDPAVRAGLCQADVVAPSLHAGSAPTFQRIHRPHPSLVFEQVVEGLVQFRAEYSGQLWLEVFLLDGINTFPDELALLRGHLERIRADRVQVNTVVRPPAESSCRPVPPDKLQRLAALLGERVEIVARCHCAAAPDFVARRDDVLELLRRRPCTLADLAAGLGVHRPEVAKYLDSLLEAGSIEAAPQGGEVYYRLRSRDP